MTENNKTNILISTLSQVISSLSLRKPSLELLPWFIFHAKYIVCIPAAGNWVTCRPLVLRLWLTAESETQSTCLKCIFWAEIFMNALWKRGPEFGGFDHRDKKWCLHWDDWDVKEKVLHAWKHVDLSRYGTYKLARLTLVPSTSTQ